MIEDNILNHIIHDFSTSADHETLIIPSEQRDSFWNWFQNKAEQYNLVYVDKQLVNEKFLAGRCYGNAQIVSVENGYGYAEGFAKATDRYILHGFNLRDNSVVDVTAQNHVDSFEQYLGGIPNVYVGVKIPLEVIQQYNGDSVRNGHININHLLYQMFLLEN